jgi:hypothetical protein
MSARNGKIARLPAGIREEINLRLDDAEEGPDLLDWLNALPEVQELLQKHFNGVPVSKQNLSEWRLGGFQEWLLRRELCAEARLVSETAGEMAGEGGEAKLIDSVAVVLAARFGGLLARWNGEVDEKLEAQAKFLNGMCRNIVRLQRSAHLARKNQFEEQRLKEEEEKRQEQDLRDMVFQPIFNDLQGQAMAQYWGGSEKARELANRAVSFLNRHSRGANGGKPLRPNNMGDSPEPSASPTQSGPVKPGQTDFAARPGGTGVSEQGS